VPECPRRRKSGKARRGTPKNEDRSEDHDTATEQNAWASSVKARAKMRKESVA
jgi:hypothetical protein